MTESSRTNPPSVNMQDSSRLICVACPHEGGRRSTGAHDAATIETMSTSKGAGRRYRSPFDLLLFLSALRLAVAAQRVRRDPLPELVRRLGALRQPVTTPEPARAARAATRACSRIGRWFGGLDTCLTRSLVAGAMLAARGDVVLHVGFRSGHELPIDGHAWLVVGNDSVQLTTPANLTDLPYTSTLEVRLEQARTGS
jgi:hypothetical protein